MIEPKIGSMFSGYAGLDLAVHEVYGGSVAWFAENNPDASKVLAHHWPGIPNLGDVTEIDWTGLEPVDIIAAGFPCQNISNAGDRKGITGDRSRLWKNVVNAVRILRPQLVILENVAAIRTRGFDVVACDLAAIGYDTIWFCLRASDVGAPHRRDRWFCGAYPATSDTDTNGWGRGAGGAGETRRRAESANGSDGSLVLFPTPVASGFIEGDHGYPSLGKVAGSLLPTPKARDHKGSGATRGRERNGRPRPLSDIDLPEAVSLLPTPKATDGAKGGPNYHDSKGRHYLPGVAVRLLPTPRASGFNDESIESFEARQARWGDKCGKPLSIAARTVDWCEYALAVHRWEEITGCPAPEPTEPAPRGGRRLSPALPEWMMGLPPGHVTEVPGISRNGQLRVIGGGVVPRQAVAALHWMAGQWAALESNAA